jgi:hypothetical protein
LIPALGETESAERKIVNTVRILIAVLASLFAFAQVAPSRAFVQIAAQQQKEATVYVMNTGQRCHQAGCRYLRYSSRPMSLSDAIAAGYTSCISAARLFPKDRRNGDIPSQRPNYPGRVD